MITVGFNIVVLCKKVRDRMKSIGTYLEGR